MGGDFPQASQGVGGIRYRTLLRVDPGYRRAGRDTLNDGPAMAKGLSGHLHLVNFAHGSFKHLLQILGGGRVLGGKFVDHGQGSLFCDVSNFSATLRWLLFSLNTALHRVQAWMFPYSMRLVAVRRVGETLVRSGDSAVFRCNCSLSS